MDPHLVSVAVVLLSVVCLGIALLIGCASRYYRLTYSTSGAEVVGVAYVLASLPVLACAVVLAYLAWRVSYPASSVISMFAALALLPWLGVTLGGKLPPALRRLLTVIDRGLQRAMSWARHRLVRIEQERKTDARMP